MKWSVFSHCRIAAFAGILCWILTFTPLDGLHAASRVGSLPGEGIRATSGTSREPFWAKHGRLTFGFEFGYGIENNIPRDISHIQMMVVEPQVGIIAWDSPRSRLPVERFEISSEGILGSAYHPGGYLVGNSLLFRFGLHPVGRLAPFIDAGSGPLYTTLNHGAKEITGNIQFLSQGGAGIQYFFKPQQALIFAYRYFHMSNGGLQEPNYGFNGSMVTVGFCWLGRPHQLLSAAAYRRPLRFLHLP